MTIIITIIIIATVNDTSVDYLGIFIKYWQTVTKIHLEYSPF